MVEALTDDGMAVIWSTAYLDEAERCDSVLLLNDGELAFDGPPEALTGGLKERSFRLENVVSNAARYSPKHLIWTASVTVSFRAQLCA